MTFNCSAGEVVVRNSDGTAQDDKVCEYLYVGGNKVSLGTETSRSVSSCQEAVPLFVDYDLGVSAIYTLTGIFDQPAQKEKTNRVNFGKDISIPELRSYGNN